MPITTPLVAFALAIAGSARCAQAAKAQICSPDTCIAGTSSSHVFVTDTNTQHAYIPGSYPSTPSTSADHFLTPLNQSAIASATTASKSEDAGAGALLITHPTWPVSFNKPGYRGDIQSFQPETLAASIGTSTGGMQMQSMMEGCKSLYLPQNWYAVPADARGQVIWGAVVDEKELPRDLGRTVVRMSSSMCSTPCTSNGICVPPRANGTSMLLDAAMCVCREGWAGMQCEQCAKGYYGPECKPCHGDCTVCDDGLAGSGACIGTKRDSSACGCLHGSCAEDGSCTCSAGYVTNTTVSDQKCNACIAGFFQTANGDCSACPAGCTSCTRRSGSPTEAVCTACSAPLQLSNAQVARCQSPATCAMGQFWSNSTSSCESCSPACATCYGPSASQCLTCAAPRMNLDGQCVGVDGRGVCDTTLAGVQGVFVANNDKGRCDACPAGCTQCSTPSFTSISAFSSIRCSACADGYLLQDDKCVQTCEAGWFLPTGSADKTGSCQRCSSTCSECIGSADTCTVCPSGSFASGGNCISSCSSGTLSMNGTCATCHPDCATCSSPSASACTSCSSSRPVLSNGRCIEFCPKSSYYNGNTDASTGQQCSACDWTCASCSGAGGKSCTSCADGFTLKGGACVSATETCGRLGFAHGYGTCANALLDKADRRYLGFLVLPVLILVSVGAWWYVRRERRRTREASERFRNGMDEVDVRKRVGKYRLERLLGMERARLADDAEACAGGNQVQAKETEKKRLRELLLPPKRRTAAKAKSGQVQAQGKAGKGGKEKEGVEMQRRSSYWQAPPPPYVPSSPLRRTDNGPLTESNKSPEPPLTSSTVSSGQFSPSYAPANAFSEAQYALKQQRAAAEAIDERRHLASALDLPVPSVVQGAGTPFSSHLSSPIHPGGLLPPPRPTLSSSGPSGGAGGKIKIDGKERKTLRFADQDSKSGRDWMDEVDELGMYVPTPDTHVVAGPGPEGPGPGSDQGGVRLSELWPEMKGRKAEGWV